MRVFILILSSLLLFGCSRFATNLLNKKAESLRNDEYTLNQELGRRSQELAFAAETALEFDATPSKQSALGLSLLEQSRAISDSVLGPIRVDRQRVLERMVSDLLSEKKELVEKGDRERTRIIKEAGEAQETLQQNLTEQKELTKKVEARAEKLSAELDSYRKIKWALISLAGLYVGFVYVLPVLSAAFPALAPVSRIAGALISPLHARRASRTESLAGDLVSAVEEIRANLKTNGTINRQAADTILREWVTEADGTAAAVDELRRERKLV